MLHLSLETCKGRDHVLGGDRKSNRFRTHARAAGEPVRDMRIRTAQGCESWKMTEKVKRKLNGAASEMLATVTGRTIQDRRWSWLGHVLRMPEHRLVRQVLLNCVKPTHEMLFADVPNRSIENATKMSKDRKLWNSNRPSLRCQPLSGGVAIK